MKALSPELIAMSVFLGIVLMCAWDAAARWLLRRRERREFEKELDEREVCERICPGYPYKTVRVFSNGQPYLAAGWHEPGKR